jgi:hypothetical protein
MMAENLPHWARKEIDAICRKFLWVGSDTSVCGKCMVAWPVVCKPTEFGGLGVSDLKLQGYALQAHWLWLQKTDNVRAWSELPIKTAPEVHAFFHASTFYRIGDGCTTLFWEDKWINGDCICDIAPCLLQLIPTQIQHRQTVRVALENRQWVRDINGGMSQIAMIEYLELWNILQHISLNSQLDKLIWHWTPDGAYSAKSAYTMLHTGAIQFRGHKLIWKAWAPLRVKIFLWIAMKRRHWTADRRARHGLDARDRCYLCDQAPETIDHIIAGCPFTREV